LRWFAYNSTDTGVPQVETNPHFVASYKPTRLTWFAYNTQAEPPAVAETPQHFIGRFKPTAIANLLLLRQNNDTFSIFVPPPIPSTEPHFIGRFTPVRYTSFAFNGFDTLVPPTPEFWATALGRNLTAIDAGRSLNATGAQRSLTLTDPGRPLNAAAGQRLLTSTWLQWGYQSGQPFPNTVVPPASFEANSHFIGTFSPVRLSGFKYGANG